MAEPRAKKAAPPAEPKIAGETANKGDKAARRKIPGNLPYTSSAGVLRRVLEKIPVSEKPSVFNTDFLSTVMSASGGAARPIPPILKATGLLNQTASPTELYAQFQTQGGRPAAAYQALRNGFAEIFKRNTYAHKAPEATLIDLIIAVTGLPKTDNIVRYILSTFQVFQEYAKNYSDESKPATPSEEAPTFAEPLASEGTSQQKSLQLVYNINIVLPETTNVEVFNAIFKSLKGNLLN